MVSIAMTPITLFKTSPLSSIYGQFPVQLTEQHGWQIADHFGNPQIEQRQLQTGSVLVDWSHIGKLSISGRNATTAIATLFPGVNPAPLSSAGQPDGAVLRLTANDYFILCLPGQEVARLAQLDPLQVTAINQTGAMGCFVLAGPRRDEVLERSTAMDLRRDRIGSGSVVQTTFHTIRCTLYRTAEFELILHPRSLSESLFNAFIDVGMGVGLVPSGLATLPLRLF